MYNTNSVFSDTLAKVYGYKICPMSQVFDQDDFGEMSRSDWREEFHLTN
jgi:hypothetical protein